MTKQPAHPFDSETDEKRNNLTDLKEVREDFANKLASLNEKVVHLEQGREQALISEQFEEYDLLNSAALVAHKLCASLKTDGDKYFNDPSLKAHKLFQKKSEEHIIKARRELEKYPGWSQELTNILIATACSKVDSTPILKQNTPHTHHFVFFKTDKTEQSGDEEVNIKTGPTGKHL